jgi:N utilization substance protein B
MTRRTRGREIALQALYILDQNNAASQAEIEAFLRRRLLEPALRQYASEVVNGIAEHRGRIDGLIGKVAENWSIERMAAIDRNILRVGVFEMLFRPEVPVKVAITEALELAKRYSTAQSSRFVNGILDRLQGEATEARAIQPEPAAGPQPE